MTSRAAQLVRPGAFASEPLVRVQLAEHLDAGGWEVKCHPLYYDGSGFTVVADVEWNICDFEGRYFGLESEWIWCSPLVWGPSKILMPVSTGAVFHGVTLPEGETLLAGGGVELAVTLPRGVVDVTIHDRWLDPGQSIEGPAALRIYYDLNLDQSGVPARWYVDLTQCAEILG